MGKKTEAKDGVQYLTYEEARNAILNLMSEHKEDCDVYIRLSTMVEVNLPRSVGATIEGVTNTQLKLSETHKPHCTMTHDSFPPTLA